MKSLERLSRKKSRLVIGLMSGTSADGLDAALVRISGRPGGPHVRLIAFETIPYPRGYRSYLLANSSAESVRLDQIARLDFRIAHFAADAVQRIVRRAGYTPRQIDLIGSHGQTIRHCPEPEMLFGIPVRATLQIGHPSVIAKLTGIITVGDFRPGDIAAGGTGAPLVPLFDYLMMRSDTKNRGLLNIGGIANITVCPKQRGIDRVTAFDTGPGNMMIDGCMRALFGKEFDRNGETASAGRINTRLLRQLMRHPYLRKPVPKSTGREMFGESFQRRILRASRSLDPCDVITTVTEFTALSIYQACLRFCKGKHGIEELIVSGGGASNLYLMEALRRYFSDVTVLTSDALGIPADAKEAVCFALLANETISGRPGNVPGATGAEKPTILGIIALP